MNNDNDIKWVTPDELLKPEIKKGVTVVHITEHELKTLGVLLKSLEDAMLHSDQDHLYTLVCSQYRNMYNRYHERGGLLVKEKRAEDRLNKVIDDLEVIYKETGLDSVGVLIGNVRGSR